MQPDASMLRWGAKSGGTRLTHNAARRQGNVADLVKARGGVDHPAVLDQNFMISSQLAAIAYEISAVAN